VCKGRGTVDPGVEARKHQPPSLSLLHSAYKLTRWLTPLLPLSLSHSSQQFHSPQLRLLPFRPPPKPFEIAAKEGRVRGLRPVSPPPPNPPRVDPPHFLILCRRACPRSGFLGRRPDSGSAAGVGYVFLDSLVPRESLILDRLFFGVGRRVSVGWGPCSGAFRRPAGGRRPKMRRLARGRRHRVGHRFSLPRGACLLMLPGGRSPRRRALGRGPGAVPLR
jgi:hypothetical protein